MYTNPVYEKPLDNSIKYLCKKAVDSCLNLDQLLEDDDFLENGGLFKFPSIQTNPKIRIFKPTEFYAGRLEITMDFHIAYLSDFMKTNPIYESFLNNYKTPYFCSKCSKNYKFIMENYLTPKNDERFQTTLYYKYYLDLVIQSRCYFKDPCETLDDSHCQACIDSHYLSELSSYINTLHKNNSIYLFLFLKGCRVTHEVTDDLCMSYTKIIFF